MDRETLKELLSQKSLEELYRLRGEQYGTKDALVEDILDADDGTLAETLNFKESFAFKSLTAFAKAYKAMMKAEEGK